MKREKVLRWGMFLLLALGLAAGYGWTIVERTGGRPVAPLDDAYIHFQYARQLTAGAPWQYNTGDPPSTGATSHLYPFLLAAGLAAGVGDEGLVWFALALGALALAASAGLVAMITRQLLARAEEPGGPLARGLPAGAGLFFLLSGAVQWGYFNTMETGLFGLLLLATLAAYLDGRPRLAALAVTLAAFTRPEGLFMVALLWLVALGERPRRGRMAAYTVALVASALTLLLNSLLAGSFVATGAQAKSWLQNVPFRPLDILLSIGRDLLAIGERLTLGLLARRPWPLTPGLLPLALAGWAVLWRRRRLPALALTLGWTLLGMIGAATLITAIWQLGRYQIPFLGLLVPVAALGLFHLLQIVPAARRRPASIAVALLVFLPGAGQTIYAAHLYGQAVASTLAQQVTIADWVRANVPAGARVAVHDAGAIRYLGDHPTFDMIGLTTANAAAAWRHGSGALFERMEGAADRPAYFATYPDVMAIPYFAGTDLFQKELYRAAVPDYSRLSAAGPVQAVYEADWELAGSGNRMFQADMQARSRGGRLLARVDVADLQEEARHRLSWWEGPLLPGFATEVRQFRYRTAPEQEVLDGGRRLSGGLTVAATVTPGRPLLLVGRLHAPQANAVQVYANDAFVGSWRWPAVPGEWLESAFEIPGRFLATEEARLRLVVVQEGATVSALELFHLWLWQGHEPPTPAVETATAVRFEGGPELVGYKLAEQSPRPGEQLSLTLYWRTPDPVALDGVVFVHLYDDVGALVAQVDERPYRGTRPPYTWQPGEIVSDPHVLTLPADLGTGRYTIAAGLYDPQTLARFAVADGAGRKMEAERIFLGNVTVVAGES